MAREGQQSLIEAAQNELRKLKGSGRHLLEAIAEAKNLHETAQQVASLIASTEQSMQRAERLHHQLDLPAAPDSSSFEGAESRRSLLQKRKAELEGHPEKEQQPQRLQWKGLEPAGMLQSIVDHSVAATGYDVYGIASIGKRRLLDFARSRVGSVLTKHEGRKMLTNHCSMRASACEASLIAMEIPQVLTAIVTLASTGIPEAVHVAVMSPAEVASGRSHWAGSHHQVFRRVSDVALHALRHFTGSAVRSEGDDCAEAINDMARKAEALQSLLLWLASYRDLFRAPCRATGQLLALDLQTQQLLPPVVRPFELNPGELEMVAGGYMEAAAYHVHTQPKACAQGTL